MKKKSLFIRFLILINNLSALTLLVCYAAWFFNPSTFPLMGMVAMATPIFMACNGLFLLMWLLLRRRQFILPLLCLLAGWWHWPGMVQFHAQNRAEPTDGFTVMSYNVHYFYPSHHNGKYVDKSKMAPVISEADPDILCIQEFQNAKDWVPRHTLKHKFLSKNQSGRLAIFSAYPIIRSGEENYTTQSRGYGKFIWADVKIGADTLRIINVHLASIGLEEEDLRTFANIDEADEERLKKSGETIFSQLKHAFEIRGKQVMDVDRFMETTPYPIVLCGDFNDTPSSYAYRKVAQRLTDTFTQAGSGFGGTHAGFARKSMPLRIDYIFTSPEFTAIQHRVVRENYSDHFPVVVDFERKEGE